MTFSMISSHFKSSSTICVFFLSYCTPKSQAVTFTLDCSKNLNLPFRSQFIKKYFKELAYNVYIMINAFNEEICVEF